MCAAGHVESQAYLSGLLYQLGRRQVDIGTSSEHLNLGGCAAPFIMCTISVLGEFKKKCVHFETACKFHSDKSEKGLELNKHFNTSIKVYRPIRILAS